MTKAEELIERLCNNQTYDYGTFFNEKDSTVSGVARWGKKEPCALVTSKEGKLLIDEGMRWQRNEFDEKIKALRKDLERYDDDDLFEGEIQDDRKKIVEKLEQKGENPFLEALSTFRYLCNCIGTSYHGDVFLYDQDAQPINNNVDLKTVLNKWGDEKLKDKKVWVIPCDVHF
jgi:hypothetical protein